MRKAGGDTLQSLSLLPLNDNDPPEIQGPQNMDASCLEYQSLELSTQFSTVLYSTHQSYFTAGTFQSSN
jgi:hypothetical protein